MRVVTAVTVILGIAAGAFGQGTVARSGQAKTGIVARGKSNPKKAPAPKAAPQPAAVEPLPQPTLEQPVIPLRPSQRPAVPPRVSFENGLLTVVAENSTLADIFAAIRQVTGAKIETVGGPGGDRVAAKIGPAAPRDVLVSLLQGSHYDYVILAAADDPGKVDRVVMTPKTTAAAENASSPAPQRTQTGQTFQASPPDEDEDQDGNEGFAPVTPAPQPPDQQQQPPPQQPQAQPGNNQPKTPEQLLEDLRRLEQERQQQQQQPGANRDQRGERPR